MIKVVNVILHLPRLVSLAADLVAGTAGLFVRLLDEVTLEGVVDRGASVLLPRLVAEPTLLRLTEATIDDFGTCDLDCVELEILCFKRFAFVDALRFSAIRCGWIHSSYL